MADHIADDQEQYIAELSGTYTADEADKIVAFGTTGEADTEFTLPPTTAWVVVEVFGIDNVFGDVGFTKYSTKADRLELLLPKAQAKADAEYNNYTITALHYKGDDTADVYRGSQVQTLTLASADADIDYTPPTGSWKISDTPLPPVTQLSDGLIAHYLLNNNGDDAYGTYDATTSGAGLSFEGDMASLTLGTAADIDLNTSTFGLSSTDTLTISIWFLYDSSQPSYLLSNHSLSAVTELEIRASSSSPILSIFHGDDSSTYVSRGTRTTNNELTDGTMHHAVVVVYGSATTPKIYIDGSSVEVTVYSSTGTMTTNGLGGTNDLKIGRDFTANTPYGRISNVRIYSGEKDADFVTGLYNEGYYPKPAGLNTPTTDNLIAYYPLTGTAEDAFGSYDSTENSATYSVDDDFGSVYDGGGSITVNTSATALASWCSYWVDSGSGWTFTKTTTIPSSLTTNDYRDLRLYSSTPNTGQQDDLELYSKSFRYVDIDEDLEAYYPLTDNIKDFYYNEFDMTYGTPTHDGTSAYFDGTTSDVIHYPHTLTLHTTAFTVSGWVKTPSHTSAVRAIVSNHCRVNANGSAYNEGGEIGIYADNKFYVLYMIRNQESYTDSNSNALTSYGVYARSSFVPTVDTWYHVVGVVNGNESELWIDGVLDCTVSTTASVQWNSTTDLMWGNMSVGGRVSNASTRQIMLNGNVSRARFYSTNLSPTRIKQIYETEKGFFE